MTDKPRQTSTDNTAQTGVNAVEAIFLSMKWLFRRQLESDFGIDAQAEIVNDEGNPTGQACGCSRFIARGTASDQDGDGPLRGTDGSNPSPSSAESGTNQALVLTSPIIETSTLVRTPPAAYRFIHDYAKNAATETQREIVAKSRMFCSLGQGHDPDLGR
jgi:hypothetical protein